MRAQVGEEGTEREAGWHGREIRENRDLGVGMRGEKNSVWQCVGVCWSFWPFAMFDVRWTPFGCKGWLVGKVLECNEIGGAIGEAGEQSGKSGGQ